MMENLQPSRRKFLKATGLSALLTGIVNQSVFAGSGNKVKPEDAIKDLEKISVLLGAKDKPAIWLFTGDSITHGAKHTKGYRSYPEVFGERIRWEMQRMRDVVINTGISGNTTANILDDFEWRVSQFRPAVVSLMLGTNDCIRKGITLEVFEKNLDVIITKIRASGAIPILHTPNIVIPEKAPDRGATLPLYVPVIRKVAENRNAILVDNYRHWEDTMKNDTSVNVYRQWLNDPLHPGEKGHQEIARLLFKKLSIFDPKEPTCGGAYYEGEH